MGFIGNKFFRYFLFALDVLLFIFILVDIVVWLNTP